MSGLRIIGGRYRRRRVHVAATNALRPTPDRVRETLFNWLQPHIQRTHCLDLFAGSGILGLEALSRGAAKVVCIDHNPQAIKAILETAAAFGDKTLTATQTDALHWLQQPPAPPQLFDIVFLDPPFYRCDYGALLQQLQCAWLASDALTYLESATPLTPATLPGGWELLRQQRTAKVFYHLLRFKKR